MPPYVCLPCLRILAVSTNSALILSCTPLSLMNHVRISCKILLLTLKISLREDPLTLSTFLSETGRKKITHTLKIDTRHEQLI